MVNVSTSIAGDIPEAERLIILAQLCRMCTPDIIAACEGYWNVKPHLGKVGDIYTHLKPSDDIIAQLHQLPQNVDADYMDLKVGETSDLPARMQSYAQECVGVPLIWAYHYPTIHSRLVVLFKIPWLRATESVALRYRWNRLHAGFLPDSLLPGSQDAYDASLSHFDDLDVPSTCALHCFPEIRSNAKTQPLDGVPKCCPHRTCACSTLYADVTPLRASTESELRGIAS
ncbi:hypothetical protein C8R44DRAFT_892372 [Mycena epipterygia]|nr:hypothetical protein C8R44DRAFT_892372 [Mycena epipterygia]